MWYANNKTTDKRILKHQQRAAKVVSNLWGNHFVSLPASLESFTEKNWSQWKQQKQSYS